MHFVHFDDQFSKKVVNAHAGRPTALTSYRAPDAASRYQVSSFRQCVFIQLAVLYSITRWRQAPNSKGAYVGFKTQKGHLRRHVPLRAYSASSFCIFVTTRLTNPLIALCTLEGLTVSVIPVQTNCPSGAPLT
jgi:hypothetical protein